MERHFRIYFLWTILFLVSLTGRGAENKIFRFRQFSTAEGLPNGMVRQTLQDAEGFMWIATFYGLYRYDGYEVRPFKAVADVPAGTYSNDIICLAEDSARNLWVGTQNGLLRLDRNRKYAGYYLLPEVDKQRVNSLCFTRSGELYVGTIRRLARFDFAGDSLVVLSPGKTEGVIPEGINVQTIYEDKNGEILIGTWRQGLFRYSPFTQEFVRQQNFSTKETVLDILEDSRGGMWMATDGNGLLKVGNSSVYRQMEILEHYLTTVENQSVSTSPAPVVSLAEDPVTHTLWVGTLENLWCMNLDREGEFSISGDMLQGLTSSIRDISDVSISHNGSLWISTEQGNGIFIVEKAPDLFFSTMDLPTSAGAAPAHVQSICIDSAGGCYMAVGKNLEYYKDGEYSLIRHSQNVQYLSSNRAGTEIFASFPGWGIIRVRDGKKIGTYRRETTGFLPSNHVYSLLEDHCGNRWVGTDRGLGICYADGREFKLAALDPLLSTEIVTMEEDRNGALWLATTAFGVIKVTGGAVAPDSIVCRQYSFTNGRLPIGTPLCFFTSAPDGTFWLGMDGSGLCRYDTVTDRFYSVHTDYNLPGDMAACIEADDYGNFWIGTNAGLVRLSLSFDGTLTGLRVFTIADGLTDNFFYPNASCSHDGTLYFGSGKGLVYFRPSDMVLQSIETPLAFTDIEIGQTGAEICFTSLGYRRQEIIQYAYRLRGYDDNWHRVDATHRKALYPHLAEGSYIFELKATDENGVWGRPIQLEFFIEGASFWSSGKILGVLFAFILLLAGILLFFRLHGKKSEVSCGKNLSLDITLPAGEWSEEDQRFLQIAAECVNRHLSDTDFDINRFAEEMSMSRSSLYNRMKETSGMNPLSFIRAMRLKAAAGILEEQPGIRIADLADRVGYNDPKYFSSCFKKEFGKGPSDYGRDIEKG